MNLLSRIAIAILTVYAGMAWAADAPFPVPSKLVARCERYLIDRGWLNPPARAKVFMPEDAKVVEVKGNVLKVTVDKNHEAEPYARTGRDVTDLIRIDKHFPRSFFELEHLRGKKVLDLACGEGFAVEQLLREGVDTVGLDIHLTPYMKTKSYFVQASAHQTGFPPQTFDIIYSAQGPFKYLEHQPIMMEALMKEAHRILKKGGVLRISPIHGLDGNFLEHGGRPEIDLIGTPFAKLPKGMRLKSWPNKDWFFWADPGGEGFTAHYWLEIERVD